MSILPDGEIGVETHPGSGQLLYITDEKGKAIVGEEEAERGGY